MNRECWRTNDQPLCVWRRKRKILMESSFPQDPQKNSEEREAGGSLGLLWCNLWSSWILLAADKIQGPGRIAFQLKYLPGCVNLGEQEKGWCPSPFVPFVQPCWGREASHGAHICCTGSLLSLMRRRKKNKEKEKRRKKCCWMILWNSVWGIWV